ncbi:MAG: hypothetical protein PIR02_08790 [Microbacterium enclense]
MSGVEGAAMIPAWMIQDRTVPRRALLVFAALSARAGTGPITAPLRVLAAEAGCTVSQVSVAIAKLEALGVVVRDRGRRFAVSYTLHPSRRPRGLNR